MRSTRTRLVPLLAVLAAAACADDGPGVSSGPATGAPEIVASGSATTARPDTGAAGGAGRFVRLAPFDSCAALLEHVKAEASSRVGPYGLDGGGTLWPMPVDFDMAVADEAADGTVAVGTVAAAGDGDSSGAAYTNVQEAGIDEPDLVKTDGERILAIVDDTLYVVGADPANPIVLGSLRLPAVPHELILHGDRAIAFAQNVPYETAVTSETAVSLPSPEGVPSTAIYEISIAEAANPALLAHAQIEGSYLSARLIGGRLRVGLAGSPSALPWLYPSVPAGEDAAEEANRRIIEESELADWTPAYTLAIGDIVLDGDLLPCDRLHHPSEFSGFDVVSVLDLDMDTADGALAEALGGAAPATVGVLGAGRVLYSSHDRMYLATSTWAPSDGAPVTSIHAFSLDPQASTEYVASGEVAGELLSQFSLDEHAGYLRVIVTAPASGQADSESRLIVLEEQGDALVSVGEVGGLGRGERLYSARLMGDVGFAVTFRQIDPFYVLDLSDPTNPRVVGELKIPGFSTYLHPLGDVAETGLVLGVGQDATDDGATTGLKLSVFDVSQPSAPREVATWVLPAANSGAEYDHRAFQIHGTNVILPVNDWANGFAGAVVLDAAGGTVTELGRVEHTPQGRAGSDCRQLGVDDFPADDSSLYWDVRSGAVVQVCGPNDAGGWNGLDDVCWSGDLELLEQMFWTPEGYDAAVTRLQIGAADLVEVCYPDQSHTAIERSFVIDGALWTYSRGHLQANTLDGLSELGAVGLSQ